jgi:hypothetical protein
MIEVLKQHRRLSLLAIVALAAALIGLTGGVVPPAARAACGTTCVKVDAIPGGGIDTSASVSGSFSVDVILEGSGNNVAAWNFSLVYDQHIVQAGTPVPLGGTAALLDCSQPPPSGTEDQSTGGDDQDPSTQEAFISCVSTSGSVIGDGAIASVPFTVIGSGTFTLHLVAVSVSDNNNITRVACDPEGTSEGSCSDATISTNGAPPPPPPPPAGDQCAVAYAIDGETVQCVDGSRVRFVGVASPLGGDPGAGWASALTNWFLAGKTLALETDVTPFDQFGSRYGYPHVIGSDGNDYNISALLIYVGMAHHLSDGVNVRNDAWFDAAQVWARTACWNMWASGNPFAFESGC